MAVIFDNDNLRTFFARTFSVLRPDNGESSRYRLKWNKGHSIPWRALFVRDKKLNYSDIDCSGTFWSLLYIKGNSAAFIEGFKTVPQIKQNLID
jgi:hypothetical protein